MQLCVCMWSHCATTSLQLSFNLRGSYKNLDFKLIEPLSQFNEVSHSSNCLDNGHVNKNENAHKYTLSHILQIFKEIKHNLCQIKEFEDKYLQWSVTLDPMPCLCLYCACSLGRRTEAGVSHCPNSNFSLKSGVCDVRRLRAAGVKVCICICLLTIRKRARSRMYSTYFTNNLSSIIRR